MSTEPATDALPRDAELASSRSGNLPIRRDLTPAYVFSLVIALLMAISAITGLLFSASIYPTDELVLAFVPVDLYHIVVGLPILLGSMWLARRGRLLGLLCWPGALLYVLYNYVLSLVGVPFGPLFLPYLLLVTLSGYTLIGVVANIDGQAVRQRLFGAMPARAAGGVLAGLSGLFIAMAVVGILAALLNQRPTSELDIMLWIADLSTVGSACLVGGILLMQRTALGYTTGTGLLLAFSMLFMGLIPVLVFPALYDGSPIDVASLVMMFALGLLCLGFFAYIARGIARSSPPSLEDAHS